MKINVPKTKFSDLWNQPLRVCLEYEGKKVEQINNYDHYKYLGIWISLTLDWDKHVNSLLQGIAATGKYLNARKFTTRQKIIIINQTIIAKLHIIL